MSMICESAGNCEFDGCEVPCSCGRGSKCIPVDGSLDNELRIKEIQGIKEEQEPSTNIPISCNACPISLHCKGIYAMNVGTVTCRETWRKIWEYVNK